MDLPAAGQDAGAGAPVQEVDVFPLAAEGLEDGFGEAQRPGTEVVGVRLHIVRVVDMAGELLLGPAVAEPAEQETAGQAVVVGHSQPQGRKELPAHLDAGFVEIHAARQRALGPAAFAGREPFPGAGTDEGREVAHDVGHFAISHEKVWYRVLTPCASNSRNRGASGTSRFKVPSLRSPGWPPPPPRCAGPGAPPVPPGPGTRIGRPRPGGGPGRPGRGLPCAWGR